MFDKRIWSNVTYVVILFVLCLTIWRLTTTQPTPPPPLKTLTPYAFNTTYVPPVHTLPPDDYHRLINLTDFTFTILSLPCNDTVNPLLLVLIHSDPKKFATRSILRETWARNTPQVKVLFATGLVEDDNLTTRLRKENLEHGDLIQGSFRDAYRNMTYKHVMVLKYALYHCPQARYILKTDDDVFVNVPSTVNFVNVLLSPYGAADVLLCSPAVITDVMRSWRSKWRVSFKEYSGKTYPPYCQGSAILYSPDVAFDLYREAQRAAYFWIDDVHITGTMAAKVHLGYVSLSHLVLKRRNLGEFLREPRLNRTFLYSPELTNDDIKALWQRENA